MVLSLLVFLKLNQNKVPSTKHKRKLTSARASADPPRIPSKTPAPASGLRKVCFDPSSEEAIHEQGSGRMHPQTSLTRIRLL